MDFTINGKRLTLDATDVRVAVEGVMPGSVRSHVVEIDGIEYPVKQAFAEATGLDLLDFTTNHARNVLRRLGFNVVRRQ